MLSVIPSVPSPSPSFSVPHGHSQCSQSIPVTFCGSAMSSSSPLAGMFPLILESSGASGRAGSWKSPAWSGNSMGSGSSSLSGTCEGTRGGTGEAPVTCEEPETAGATPEGGNSCPASPWDWGYPHGIGRRLNPRQVQGAEIPVFPSLGVSQPGLVGAVPAHGKIGTRWD